MSDYTREEVEYMALAAGIDIGFVTNGERDIARLPVSMRKWEPWKDKAQCFDLMVDAGIDVSEVVSMEGEGVMAESSYDPDNQYDQQYFSFHPDKAAAYMTAICRAAVEKGRAIKQETEA